MGQMSEWAIEREGMLDRMTSLDLAKELYGRLKTEFAQIEDFDDGMAAHLLISELNSYIERSKKHVAMDKEPVVEKEA